MRVTALEVSLLRNVQEYLRVLPIGPRGYLRVQLHNIGRKPETMHPVLSIVNAFMIESAHPLDVYIHLGIRVPVSNPERKDP
jgi:hypothetical protein